MGHSRVALAVSLLFILCGFYTSFFLPFLGFLAFLLSSSFPFFQKNRQSMGSTENVSQQNVVAMNKEETQEEEKREEEVVQASACRVEEVIQASACREEEAIQASACREEVADTMSNCSDAPSDLQEVDLLEFSSEFSSESVSDDESLIEISLPDGNHVEDYSEPVIAEKSKGEFIWDLLPESVFKQTGLMELLSEINEEDNMIEIDIARGSIKCSSLGIMA